MPDLAPQPLLTPLQRQVLRSLAGGHTLRQTAEELHYGYVYMRKVAAAAAAQLGASTATAAVYQAARRGLI